MSLVSQFKMARQCLREPIIKPIVLLINKFSVEGLFSGSLRYPPPCGIIERLCTYTVPTIHRVGRVLSFFSCRRNWDSPTPSPAHSRGSGGSPIPTREHTLWYFINTCTLCYLSIWGIYIYMGYWTYVYWLPVHYKVGGGRDDTNWVQGFYPGRFRVSNICLTITFSCQ